MTILNYVALLGAIFFALLAAITLKWEIVEPSDTPLEALAQVTFVALFSTIAFFLFTLAF